MKFRVLLVGALLVAASTQAFAQGPYVGISGGASFIHESDIEIIGAGSDKVSYDTGYGFGVNAGYNFDGFRIEAEISHRVADVDKVAGISYSGADITVNSYMANGILDFKNNSAVTPFIGVGVGMLKGSLDDNGYKLDDTVLGYQAIAGVSIAANSNVSFDLSYKLQGAAADFEKDGGKLSYMSSNVMAGIRYNF